MSLRRRSVLLRVALLVLVPLLFLVGISAYSITASARTALALIRSKVMVEDLGQPVARLQRALTRERAQVSIYYASPKPATLAALRHQQTLTNRAAASFAAAARSAPVRSSASVAGRRAIAVLSGQLAGLPALRKKIASMAMTGQQAFSSYNSMIAASYKVLEQAIRQEGPSTQVLPAIAVIELAISNEYLQQESALLDGDFAARAFPARAHQEFVSLVGAHRLLYAQSYSYLSAQDRGQLNRDLSPRAAHRLALLEDKLVASGVRRGPPPVSPSAWNGTVAVVSAQIQRAVGQAEMRLVSRAKTQASSELRDLYLEGGIGLAAVILSLALSWWIAFKLVRQLRGLRDSALDMATVRLPDVVRRLRDGEMVDVTVQVPLLTAGPDEIGQVKAAFNAAQRTAVEAAVDEARVRRGIGDVFRNLARRSQSLLERQMALLDTLERRAVEPDDLEGLFRMDHLATRMRRHAESLIVLAGDAPRRMFRDPVPFVDVLRAAAAEVEDYTRIRVICRGPASLAGPAVADVIHMLAEFAENAASFSPGSTEVGITGDLVANGFAVDIEDRGPGMSDEEIAAANATLAYPPPFDLTGSDRLGLFVAAQLARRHGIRVMLRSSPYGGITAIVLIPRDLVVLTEAIGSAAADAWSDRVPARLSADGPSRPGTSLVGLASNGSGLNGSGSNGSGSNGDGPDGLGGGDLVPDALSPSSLGAEKDRAERVRHFATRDAQLRRLPDGVGAAADPARRDPSGFVPSAAAGMTAAEVRASGWDALLGGAGGSDLAAQAPGPAESGLPQRQRQASLAPELRGPVIFAAPYDPESPSPGAARGVMSAFRSGWRRGAIAADNDHARGGAGAIRPAGHADSGTGRAPGDTG